MKKIYYILSLFLCSVLLTACGAEGTETQQDRVAVYTDIQSETGTIFSLDNDAGRLVGMQYHQKEAVQIRAKRNNGLVDIYLYRPDGSHKLLLEGMLEDYYYFSWYMDEEGSFYGWQYAGDIVKLDPSGKKLCSIKLEDVGTDQINDICQLTDGTVVVTYVEGSSGSSYTLAKLDAAAGKLSKAGKVRLDGFGRIAAGEESLLYMDDEGIREYNMDDGSMDIVLPFTGTSYLLGKLSSIKGFCLLEDNRVEILRYDRSSSAATSETLCPSTETTTKVLLTLRGYNVSKVSFGKWMKEQIALFNQQSDSYLVVLDECQNGIELEDFARQTSIEMVAGNGPDLLIGNVLGDYAYGAIQKGALEDLAPYMEGSGIKEEDYFPAAFGCWREGDGVYGAGMYMRFDSYRIDEALLGGRTEPGIGTLVDALLAWEEDAVFYSTFSSRTVLGILLQGSEDLWGMVDWEAGTCDFSGDLFSGILEASKRYGYDERNRYQAVAEMRSTDLLHFDTLADQEAEQMVVAGVLFDDGCHGAIDIPYAMLAVNANSAHKEGAWEFLCFLLGEKAQSAFESSDPNVAGGFIPVNKKAFEACTEQRIAKWIKMGFTEHDTAEGKVAEYRETLEDARALPIRTMPLLDIIREEAGYYFDGTKGIEEVVPIIQNRVQLYINENK